MFRNNQFCVFVVLIRNVTVYLELLYDLLCKYYVYYVFTTYFSSEFIIFDISESFSCSFDWIFVSFRQLDFYRAYGGHMVVETVNKPKTRSLVLGMYLPSCKA